MRSGSIVGMFLILLIIAVAMMGCGATKNLTAGLGYESGMRKFDAKKIDEALVIFQEVAESESVYANRARYHVGECFKLQFKWQEAIDQFQMVVDSELPTSYLAAQSRSRIAQIREGRKDIERIKIIHGNYSKTDPEAAAGALLDLGSVYENKLDDYDNAIKAYRQLIEEFPGTNKAAQGQVNIGNIYFYKLYDYVGGWPEFQEVNIENYPKLSYRVAEVESLLRNVNKVKTEIMVEMDFIARAQKRKIPEIGEITGYEIYGIRENQVATSFLSVGIKWRSLKNYPRSLDTYRMLIDRLPLMLVQAAEARYGIASIYQEEGQYMEAADAYVEYIKYHPSYFKRDLAIYNMAICYEALRDYEEAYESYKTYSETYPDGKFYKAAELKVRQYEYDEDQDGFPYYKEAIAGTSDTDANAHPKK